MSRLELEALQEFDYHFRNWVRDACQKWNYPLPSDDYFTEVYNRIPEGLRVSLGQGIANGQIIPENGYAFKLKGLSSTKGPYHWFSRSAKNMPAPNWEYYVQVAEYIRLCEMAILKDFEINFEDDTMDIAMYREGKLMVYFEVKEKAKKIQELINSIRLYQSNVNLIAPDRGNDPLRKAKCIVKRKPDYFVGTAIGARFEYKVIYPEERSFQFIGDLVPVI